MHARLSKTVIVKKHNILSIVICLLAFVFFAACAEGHSLSFRDVSYVKDFPQHSTITESTKVPMDIPGLIDARWIP